MFFFLRHPILALVGFGRLCQWCGTRRKHGHYDSWCPRCQARLEARSKRVEVWLDERTGRLERRERG